LHTLRVFCYFVSKRQFKSFYFRFRQQRLRQKTDATDSRIHICTTALPFPGYPEPPPPPVFPSVFNGDACVAYKEKYDYILLYFERLGRKGVEKGWHFLWGHVRKRSPATQRQSARIPWSTRRINSMGITCF